MSGSLQRGHLFPANSDKQLQHHIRSRSYVYPMALDSKFYDWTSCALVATKVLRSQSLSCNFYHKGIHMQI